MRRYFLLILFTSNIISCQEPLPGFRYTNFNNTPVEKLVKLVKKDDYNKIIQYVNEHKDVNINYQDSVYGMTALDLAIANNKYNALRGLLKMGADPNIRNPTDNSTPFLNACNSVISYDQNCDTSYIEELIKYGANVNDQQNTDAHNRPGDEIQETALMQAIGKSSAMGEECLNVVKLLVESGADINKYTLYDGHGAIYEALILGKLKIAKYLIIDKKAEIPDYIFKTEGGPGYADPPSRTYTITDFLNEEDYSKEPEKQKIKEEILDYLKSINKR